MKRFVCAAAIGSLLFASPAEAALVPGADFAPGGVVSAGLMGLSADYALGPVSLGMGFRSETDNLTSFAVRAMGKLHQSPQDAVAVIGGVWLDPGYAGSRGYMVPDVGLAVAHRFEAGQVLRPFLSVPVVLRAAVTFTTAEQRSSFYGPPPTGQAAFRGHFFQRLALGPNSHLGVAFLLTDNVELTIGSGTTTGLRLKF